MPPNTSGKAKPSIEEPIEPLREICLALPGAVEKLAWGEPTFRVRDKMFAMYDNNHHDAGRIAVWVKAPPLAQGILVESDPERFFVPPYVGVKGWVGVRLDLKKVDWKQVAAILEDGYKMCAISSKRQASPQTPYSGSSDTSPPRKQKRS
jgi:predicted DNA-binding protein (MmcQ/YjbR family)